MTKILYLSILVSFFFMIMAILLLNGMAEGPFFIDSTETLASFAPIQDLKQRVAVQEENIKKMDHFFSDSLARLSDSLNAEDSKRIALIELLNLESNVNRHKMIDSISIISKKQMDDATVLFNTTVASFCKKKNIPVLFSSNANTIVYGLNSKADVTDALKFFMEK